MWESKIWFQTHYDRRVWTRLESDVDLDRYNLRHTQLLRQCAQRYRGRGCLVTVERQNKSRIQLTGANISGRAHVLTSREDRW